MKMTKRWLSPIGGLLIFTCFSSFSQLALEKFPIPFDPYINWLSDLGAYVLNPAGAIFFNLGCFSTAFALLVFTIGLPWWSNVSGNLKRLLPIGKSFGYLSSFSLVMVGLVTEDNYFAHIIWAGILFMFVCLVIGVVGSLTYANRGILRPVSISGVVIAVIVFYFNVVNHSPILELIAVLMVMLFFSLISLNMIIANFRKIS